MGAVATALNNTLNIAALKTLSTADNPHNKIHARPLYPISCAVNTHTESTLATTYYESPLHQMKRTDVKSN